MSVRQRQSGKGGQRSAGTSSSPSTSVAVGSSQSSPMIGSRIRTPPGVGVNGAAPNHHLPAGNAWARPLQHNSNTGPGAVSKSAVSTNISSEPTQQGGKAAPLYSAAAAGATAGSASGTNSSSARAGSTPLSPPPGVGPPSALSSAGSSASVGGVGALAPQPRPSRAAGSSGPSAGALKSVSSEQQQPNDRQKPKHINQQKFPPSLSVIGSSNKPQVMEGLSSLSSLPTTGVQDEALRDRFLHLCQSLVGERVTVSLTDGRVVEGILHTFTPFESSRPETKNLYVLRACKLLKKGDEKLNTSKAAPLPNIVEGSTAVIRAEHVRKVDITNFSLRSGIPSLPHNSVGLGASRGSVESSPFRTDEDIARKNEGGIGVGSSPRARNTSGGDLVAAGSAWTSPPSIRSTQGLSSPSAGPDSLNWRKRAGGAAAGVDSTSGTPQSGGLGGGYASAVKAPSSAVPTNTALKGSIGSWDQFSANERLFNVRAGFDENQYTTRLDKSAVPDHVRAKAERVAREIEGSTTENIHLAEERGQKVASDYDEEDLYSGVLGKKTPSASTSKATSTAVTTSTLVASSTAPPAESKTPISLTNLESLSVSSKGETALNVKSDDLAHAQLPKPDGAESKINTALSKKPQLPEVSSRPDAGAPPGLSRRPDADGSNGENKTDRISETPPVKSPKVDDDDDNASAGKQEAAAAAAPVKEQKPEPTESVTKEESDPDTSTSSVDEVRNVPQAALSKEKPNEKPSDTPKNEAKAEEEKKPKPPMVKMKSKLNANAPEFTLNPSAKSFTPGGMRSASPAAVDSTANAAAAQQVQPPSMSMGMPNYMHAQGQHMHPGMMHPYGTGNPAATRGGYVGMPPHYTVPGSQHAGVTQQAQQQHQQQQQPSQQPGGQQEATEQTVVQGGGGAGTSSQHNQQQQQVMPPPPYMAGRFYPPGAAHSHHQTGQHRPHSMGAGSAPGGAGFSHPQMVGGGGPQMQVLPGPGTPYMYGGGPMQPGMPVPPQMTQPSFYPPGAGMHYGGLSYGGMAGSAGGRGIDDDQQGFRGGGRVGGRGGRGRRSGGRKGGRGGGRGGYHNNHSHGPSNHHGNHMHQQARDQGGGGDNSSFSGGGSGPESGARPPSSLSSGSMGEGEQDKLSDGKAQAAVTSSANATKEE